MKDDISLVFAGDFFPPPQVVRAVLRRSQPSELLRPAVRLFQGADLAVANLEYPLTTAGVERVKHGGCHKGDPEAATVLKQAGIGLVSLANNHTLDYGEKGLADTLEACARENLAVVGAGLTRQEAMKPYYVTIKGRQVAVIAVCENEFSIACEEHGGAYGLEPIANYYSIRKAKETADIVIVLLHGGIEHTHYPRPGTIRTCRFFADVGASAVVCHHPHYVQGCEVYHGVPILYSLGTLFSAGRTEPDYLEVPIARLEFSSRNPKPSIHFDFFRVSMEHQRLIELNEDDLRAMRERFRGYSEALASPETIRLEWDKYCQSNKSLYMFLLFTIPLLLLRIAKRLRIDHLVNAYAKLKHGQLLILENVIRCESHREAVLHLLEGHRRG